MGPRTEVTRVATGSSPLRVIDLGPPARRHDGSRPVRPDIGPAAGSNTQIRLPGDRLEVPRLEDARHRGDLDAEESAGKAIENAIRLAARGICEKYILAPHSTDFAVLFLPTEGLFAEVIRRPELVDALQRDCHIMVAGPTTLVSLLVAFRMGFRSLAIQKRSGEVWTVLSAVKTESGKFGEMLDKVGRKLREAQTVIAEEVGVRRRAMDPEAARS